MLRVCRGHNGYGGGYDPLAGHEKEDITNKVSDPFFNIVTPRSDIDEKFMLMDDFWWWRCSLSEGLQPALVCRMEPEYYSAF